MMRIILSAELKTMMAENPSGLTVDHIRQFVDEFKVVSPKASTDSLLFFPPLGAIMIESKIVRGLPAYVISKYPFL